jgi:hypothetical protein
MPTASDLSYGYKLDRTELLPRYYARNMASIYKSLAGTRDDVLFAQIACVLSVLIGEREYGLPIGVFIQDVKGTKIRGTYDWDSRNFALSFTLKQREGDADKLTFPVRVEFLDGAAIPVVIATLIVKEAGTPDSPQLSFELR